MKALLVLVIHMCLKVKARESVGRLEKPARDPGNSLPTKRLMILNINDH